MQRTPGQSFPAAEGESSRLAALAGWESEGGSPAADPGSASSPRPRQQIMKAIIAGWRRRSGRAKRALAFAFVAIVCLLQSRVAYRRWQRRRPDSARRSSGLRPAWARLS